MRSLTRPCYGQSISTQAHFFFASRCWPSLVDSKTETPPHPPGVDLFHGPGFLTLKFYFSLWSSVMCQKEMSKTLKSLLGHIKWGSQSKSNSLGYKTNPETYGYGKIPQQPQMISKTTPTNLEGKSEGNRKHAFVVTTPISSNSPDLCAIILSFYAIPGVFCQHGSSWVFLFLY